MDTKVKALLQMLKINTNVYKKIKNQYRSLYKKKHDTKVKKSIQKVY